MLSVKCKTPVSFEFSDGVQVTTVTIAQDEESESLRAKLQRVLELESQSVVEHGRLIAASMGLPVRQPGAALQAAEELFDAEGAEKRALAQSAMGWGEDGPDIEDLPER